ELGAVQPQSLRGGGVWQLHGRTKGEGRRTLAFRNHQNFRGKHEITIVARSGATGIQAGRDWRCNSLIDGKKIVSRALNLKFNDLSQTYIDTNDSKTRQVSF